MIFVRSTPLMNANLVRTVHTHMRARTGYAATQRTVQFRSGSNLRERALHKDWHRDCEHNNTGCVDMRWRARVRAWRRVHCTALYSMNSKCAARELRLAP
jgi:hypothetical protein